MSSSNTKRRLRAPLIGVGLALAVLAVLLVFQQNLLTPTYEVTGRVAGFGNDAHSLIIAHEDIPGYMPAMTMPFTVEDPNERNTVEAGQAVSFTLHVEPDRSWITDLTVLPDDAVPPLESSPLADAAQDAITILSVGDAVPDVPLVNQDGAPFRLADFQGQWVILTFIYTRCPLPDFCPRMSLQFQALQDQLAPGTAHLLSISFDPEHDTPAILREYAKNYTNDTSNWTFATGTLQDVAAIAGAFGVFYEAEGNTFDHNLTTALINEEGRVAHLWRGNLWRPADVLAQLEASGTP